MAANTLNVNQAASVAGLGTSSYNVVTAGFYTVACQSTLPNNSGLQIAINKNGSPVITAIGGATANPTPTQPSIGTSARVQCAAADLLQVVLTSSAAADNLPNGVKSVINIFQGE